MIWWYVARAAGIVALLMSGLAVVWGLLLSSRFGNGRPAPRWLMASHRFIGLLTVTFTGVHLGGLVVDDFVEFGWREILIPYASGWKPGAVALGIVSFYLLLAVQISSSLMSRIPRTWWRAIHFSSYAVFWFGLVHGAQAGTDAANPLYLLSTIGLTLVTLFLTVYRILTSRKARRGQHRPSGSREMARA